MHPSTEFARLWNSEIPGVELFNAQLIRHRFDKHMHEEYTIGLNDGGQGCFNYRGDTWRSPPGSLNLVNPGELHTGQADTEVGWRFRNFYISVPQVNALLTQLEWGDRKLLFLGQAVVLDRPLYTAFDALFKTLSQPTSQLAQQSLLLDTFARLIINHADTATPFARQFSTLKPETRAVSTIRDYLEAHYAEPVSVEMLARLVGLSPYYLIRCFRQQVGMPPHRYQRHWQLMQAKRSLRMPRSLAEIAAEHGFYDQSHLNRSFKRAFGITPGQYQKDNLIQDPHA